MLLAAFIWGTTFIAQTTGMETIGPMGFTMARYMIGAVAVLPLALYEARSISLTSHMKFSPKQMWQAIGLGVLMFGGIGFQQTALQYTQVANAAFLTALYVPCVPLLAWLMFRTRIMPKIWIGLMLSIAGSYMLSGGTDVQAQWGDILVIAGALFWAGHIVLIGVVTQTIKAPFQLAFLQSVICAGLASILTYSFEKPDFADFLPVMPELIYAGFFSVGIAYTLQLVAQRYASATLAAFILSLEAVFAALSGWILLGQTLTTLALIGCITIFLAVLLANTAQEKDA
jgi:drug/metabolite transporter (DMT)-like permease